METKFDISPYLSGGRHAVTALTAFAGGIGVHSLYGVSIDDVKTGFDHIWNGLNEIAIGVGVLAPLAMGAWATIKGTMSSKVADVKAAQPGVVVDVVKKVAPEVLVNTAAEVPGVKKIITSPDMAQATPSSKVTTS